MNELRDEDPLEFSVNSIAMYNAGSMYMLRV